MEGLLQCKKVKRDVASATYYYHVNLGWSMLKNFSVTLTRRVKRYIMVVAIAKLNIITNSRNIHDSSRYALLR